MKTYTPHLSLLAAVLAIGAGSANAHEEYSEAGAYHWLATHATSAAPSLPTSTATIQAKRSAVPLRDGATVHIFPDGKMGMEDRFGRAAYMTEGEVMTTPDGRAITMKGNEVHRVDALLNPASSRG